jgi:hypothetical protein
MSLHKPMQALPTRYPSARSSERSQKDGNPPQKPALFRLAAGAGYSSGRSQGRGLPTETLLRISGSSATQILGAGRVQITGVLRSHLRNWRQGFFLDCMVNLFSSVAPYMPYLGPKPV